MVKLVVVCATGLVAFAFPRLLIAAGVPLLNWIQSMGTFVGAAKDWIDPDIALWSLTLILAFFLYGVEVWKHPAQRVWEGVFKWGKVQTDAETIKQFRLLEKQRDSSRKHAAPKLVVLHDKPRDTEPWPKHDGYNVKFRVYNDSDVRAEKVGGRIRPLEFLEEGNWQPYAHDFAGEPLATRNGKSEFDLSGGDEESVYIARRPTRSGESIQLCYAKSGIPNTIPLKPAWRVGIRLVSNNAPHKDAVFQLRVSSDQSLVGMLIDDTAVDELTRRKKKAEYISGIYAESVEVRNIAFSLQVLNSITRDKMNDLQPQLLNEIRDLAPERSINLDTINFYNENDQPPCLLSEPDRTQAMAFSDVLRRVMKILDDYK